MRIAAYLRVSTDQQCHDSQRAELEDYCRRRGWANVSWFSDTACGAKQDRTALGEMMELLRRGKLDAVGLPQLAGGGTGGTLSSETTTPQRKSLIFWGLR
jgi:DNA invertase Pin-like site-specific DNA recombinase